MDKTIKILIQHILTYGIGGIVNGLARLALIPIISVYLPPDIFGVYSLLLMAISFLFVFFDLGLSYALIKQYSESGKPLSREKTVGTSITLIITAGGFVGGIVLLNSAAVSRFLFQTTQYTPFLRLAICIAFGGSLFQLFTSILRALAKSRTYVLITSLRGFSNIVFTVSLVILFSLGIEGFLWGVLISFILGIAAFLIILKPSVAFSIDFAKRLLHFGLPLMPSNLAIWLLTYADLYLLKTITGLKAVGLYQFAQEMCTVIALLLVSFERAWPQFVFSRHREESAVFRFQRIFILFFSALTFCGLAISLFRFELLSFLSAEAYEASAKVIPLLVCSGILYGTYYVFGSGLLIKGKTIFFPFITLSAAALNILLNIILIPSYGIVGAGVATVCTNCLMSLAILFLSNRYYPICYDFGKIFLVGGIGVVAYTVHSVFREFVPYPFILSILLMATFSLCLWKFVFLRSEEDFGTSDVSR